MTRIISDLYWRVWLSGTKLIWWSQKLQELLHRVRLLVWITLSISVDIFLILTFLLVWITLFSALISIHIFLILTVFSVNSPRDTCSTALGNQFSRYAASRMGKRQSRVMTMRACMSMKLFCDVISDDDLEHILKSR